MVPLGLFRDARFTSACTVYVADVLTSDGLVPTGDVAAMARADKALYSAKSAGKGMVKIKSKKICNAQPLID